MTKLKTVNIGMNKYCGPAVLSILTGRNTDECAKVISSINGSYNVAGVQLNDLLSAAKKMGFDSELIGISGSLYRTLTSIASRDGFYIITVPSHFVVIEVSNKEIFFCDNHTKEPIRAASSARLMQQCLACYRVEKRADYVEPPVPQLVRTELVTSIIQYGEEYQVKVERSNIWNVEEYNRTEILGYITLRKYELYDFVTQVTNNKITNIEEPRTGKGSLD